MEDLRGLPHVSSGYLKIYEGLEIRWNEINGKLHHVYKMEFGVDDWQVDIGTKWSELTYNFLEINEKSVLSEIELSLSHLLTHLKSKVEPSIEQRKAEVKSMITKLQNELTALSGLKELENDDD